MTIYLLLYTPASIILTIIYYIYQILP